MGERASIALDPQRKGRRLMTVKEAILELVNQLDEAQALALLEYARLIADESDRGDDGAPSEPKTRPVEYMKIGRPTSEDDPLWNIVGIVGDEYDGPTDV